MRKKWHRHEAGAVSAGGSSYAEPVTVSGLEQVLLLAGIGLLAGAINTVAGGGSLITVPALIFLGLPAPVANATNRLGVFLQSLTATQQFARRGLLPFRPARWAVAFAAAGAVVGAYLGTVVDAPQLQSVIAVAMLIMLALLLIKPQRWLSPALEPVAPGWQALAFFAVGVYGGFLQAGVGFFLLFSLVGLGGWDLVVGNALKSLIVAVFTIPALIIFLWADLVAWGPGLSLAAGSTVGAWLGTKMAVSWGPQFVRAVLVVMVSAASTRLLGLW